MPDEGGDRRLFFCVNISEQYSSKIVEILEILEIRERERDQAWRTEIQERERGRHERGRERARAHTTNEGVEHLPA
jgi:hypothetical protein